MSAYADVMASLALESRGRLRPGDTVDIAGEMSRLTLAIAAAALFGADADAAELVDGIGETLETATSLLEVAVLPLAPVVDLLPLPHVRRLRAARAKLDEVLDAIIERRRREPRDTGDLLSILLRAQEETHMSDRQLRDELRTLLLAGHETTANALAFTWYLIARHPQVEARLHAEIDAVLAARAPTANDVPALPFTRMVFAESMRLFPPAWLLGRVAIADHEARGYVVPAGSLVVLSPWAVQRNGMYYPDPERFDPDRWRPERLAERPRFSYFPFGGGSRGCLGEAFAWMEGVLVLAALAQRRRFPLADQLPEPELLPAITLKPKGGIRVRVEERLPGRVATRGEEVRERTGA
ncbi:MAG: cytochrome P450 [Acidobacteria bacterium]|nr:MAG: cytochrome P450 [Acidobacteriota bacterium]